MRPATVVVTVVFLLLMRVAGAETLLVNGKTLTKASLWQIKLTPDEGGKYKVQGSVFAIGDPVHEVLTLQALRDSQIVRAAVIGKDPEVAEFIRGVFWNDDPCAQLFAEDDFQPLKPSFGIDWYLDFQKAKAGAKSPAAEKPNCPLLAPSHFGELQFLHGMATRNGELPRTTADLVTNWAEVTYRIAIGSLDVKLFLKQDATGAKLPRILADLTPIALFRAKTAEQTRQRALGSLLHMIQDSYAHGHVTRSEATSGKPSEITQFLSYADQSASKHGHDDSWSGGTGELEKTLNVPGARDALRVCTEISRLYRLKAAWKDVRAYLEAGPLLVSPSATLAGPGTY